jgi:hypothetical protein
VDGEWCFAQLERVSCCAGPEIGFEELVQEQAVPAVAKLDLRRIALKKHQQKMFNQALGDLLRRLRAGGAVRIFEADKPDDSARRLPICWGRESLVRI